MARHVKQLGCIRSHLTCRRRHVLQLPRRCVRRGVFLLEYRAGGIENLCAHGGYSSCIRAVFLQLQLMLFLHERRHVIGIACFFRHSLTSSRLLRTGYSYLWKAGNQGCHSLSATVQALDLWKRLTVEPCFPMTLAATLRKDYIYFYIFSTIGLCTSYVHFLKGRLQRLHNKPNLDASACTVLGISSSSEMPVGFHPKYLRARWAFSCALVPRTTLACPDRESASS